MGVSSLTVSGSFGGFPIFQQVDVDYANLRAVEISVPPARASTLTTRTSDTAGTLTMVTADAFTTGQVIDMYWDDPAAANPTLLRRYNVTVGTVSPGNGTTPVPFSGGTGANLPAQDAPIRAMVPVVRGLQGNDGLLSLMYLEDDASNRPWTPTQNYASQYMLVNGAGSEVMARTLPVVSILPVTLYTYLYHAGMNALGFSDQISGDVAAVRFSHGHPTKTVKMKALIGSNT